MQENKHWAEWIEAVRHAVGGAGDPLARMMQVSEDGLKWAPLQAPDAVVACSPLSPHGAPQEGGWRIAQHAGDDLDADKTSIYDEIAGGADMVLIPRAMAMRPKDLAEVLADAPDGAWGLGFHHGGEMNLALAEAWDEPKREVHFAGDPLADFFLGDARDACDAREFEARGAKLAVALASVQKRHVSVLPKVRVFVASGDSAHRFGLSETQELAWTLANLVWQLRALETAGLTPVQSCARLVMRVAVGTDLYGALAKTRAARFLLARLVKALDLAPEHTPLLHVLTSERMLTRVEPMNNLLRHTTASLGGVLGGADMLTTLPHDWLTGSTAQSRRLARGLQLIMRHEARLGEVADPAYGADTLEVMSQDIAKMAWQKFQEIENAAGRWRCWHLGRGGMDRRGYGATPTSDGCRGCSSHSWRQLSRFSPDETLSASYGGSGACAWGGGATRGVLGGFACCR